MQNIRQTWSSQNKINNLSKILASWKLRNMKTFDFWNGLRDHPFSAYAKFS